MSTADLQRLATQYTRSVSQVNSQSQSLQQLEAQFKVIEKRVTGISHTVDASVAVAQTTQQTLGVLMAEHPNFIVTASPAASSMTLLPLIRVISPVSGTHEVIISGVNLGTKAGHVYVSPTGSEEGYRLEAPVLSWSDTKVKISKPQPFQGKSPTLLCTHLRRKARERPVCLARDSWVSPVEEPRGRNAIWRSGRGAERRNKLPSPHGMGGTSSRWRYFWHSSGVRLRVTRERASDIKRSMSMA